MVLNCYLKMSAKNLWLLIWWYWFYDSVVNIHSEVIFLLNPSVGTESNQHVNICSFAVRCDRRWPSTQWHRVYTGSGNVPNVQFESVGDFIPEPRCSKSAVGLQTRGRKMGCTRGPVGLRSEGPRVTGAPLRAKCSSVCLRSKPGGSVVVY